MRIWITIFGFLLAISIAGIVGYQIAAVGFTKENESREQQLQKEISLILSSIADIADHRNNGEIEIADWKFNEIHGNLESYVRAGGGPPSQFVYDIVEATEVPVEEDANNETGE